MIPIDQDFIVCYYCNQHIKIENSFKAAKNYLSITSEARQLYECSNCPTISYAVMYHYKPDYGDPSSLIIPINVEVRSISVKVKNDIYLFLNVIDDVWNPALYSFGNGKSIHRFNKLDKYKFLQYSLPKLINKMNNLMAFI